jgi:sulfur carrier protein ThiS
MSMRLITASICLISQLSLAPLAALATPEGVDNQSMSAGDSSPLLIATSKDKDVKDTGAENSQAPSGKEAGAGEKPFTSGSDFKTGPVTDDEKLIKPVTTDDQKKKSKGEPVDAATPEGAEKNPQLKKNVDVNVGNQGIISVGALRVAELLEITQVIDRMVAIKKDGSYVPGETVRTIEAMSVRQDLDEAILAAFLQSRRVVSELDRQIAGYDAVARVLEDKRDQSIRNNNILNFTSGGALAIAGGALQIGTPVKFQNTGDELAIIAGGLAALISGYALKIQKGQKKDSEVEPNMLAPVFGLVPAEPNKYPPAMWQYLNDHEPDQKLTRRQQLLDKWVRLEYIEALNKPSSHKHLQQLAGTIPLHKEVTIDLLRDRIPMLQDVRATIAGMSEYLDEILSFARRKH